MQGNFIMLQKEDLKEVIAEVLETIVGKNLLKEPTLAESTEYYTRDELCARLHITYYHILAHGETWRHPCP